MAMLTWRINELPYFHENPATGRSTVTLVRQVISVLEVQCEEECFSL